MAAPINGRCPGTITMVGRPNGYNQRAHQECGGFDASTINRLRAATDPDEMHFAARRTEPSAMTFSNPKIGMGGSELDREYTNTVTDEALVRAVIAAARG